MVMKWNRAFWSLGIVFGLVLVFLIQFPIVSEELNYKKLKGTGSMRPFLDVKINPRMIVVTEDVKSIEDIVRGQVYVYEKPGDDTIHRLVGIYNITEPGFYYVFKGDNNNYVDKPITYEQIKEKVIGVRYE